MLRNCLNQSKAGAIKLLQREKICAQALLKQKYNNNHLHTGSLSQHFKPSNCLTIHKIRIMSLSTTRISLDSPPLNPPYTGASEKSENDDDISSANDAKLKEASSKNNVFYEHNNIDMSVGEYTSSKNFPLCDKSLPVMPRNLITSTTAMHLQVTSTPQRQQNFTTSSTNSDRMGNQECFHCPECERMRTRSLNAPSPFQQFGPCGRIMKNSAMVMTIQDPASQRLTWYKPPLTVLVIKKVRDAAVIPPFFQLVQWFINEKRMVVFVEAAVVDDPLLTENPAFMHIKDKLMTFTEGKDDLTDKIDFIVCLGGDGTLLYASSLFQQSVPPIMAFHMGSLGFLTPFEIESFEQQVTHVLEGHAALTLRSRLRCIIMRKEKSLGIKVSSSTSSASAPPANIMPKFNSPLNAQPIPESSTVNQRALANLLVLNEVVIDRGPSPYLSNIDLYLDGKLITSVQGDGLIVSTPTGSTAYAVAAGASMIHPSVPAIMVTPICPHSLSFRPIVVPAGVELKISVSPDSRNTAWVSFDGRNRQELIHGDSLHVTTSIYPVPSICAQDQISDWFASLAECLHWNVRKKQKAMDELSDLSRYSSIASENLKSSSLHTEGNGVSINSGDSSSQKEEIAKV